MLDPVAPKKPAPAKYEFVFDLDRDGKPDEVANLKDVDKKTKIITKFSTIVYLSSTKKDYSIEELKKSNLVEFSFKIEGDDKSETQTLKFNNADFGISDGTNVYFDKSKDIMVYKERWHKKINQKTDTYMKFILGGASKIGRATMQVLHELKKGPAMPDDCWCDVDKDLKSAMYNVLLPFTDNSTYTAFTGAPNPAQRALLESAGVNVDAMISSDPKADRGVAILHSPPIQ